jgi:hypothetical protein
MTKATGRPTREWFSIVSVLTHTPRPAAFTPVSPIMPAAVSVTPAPPLPSSQRRIAWAPSITSGRSMFWATTGACPSPPATARTLQASRGSAGAVSHHSSSIRLSASTRSNANPAASAIPRTSSSNSGVWRSIAATNPVAPTSSATSAAGPRSTRAAMSASQRSSSAAIRSRSASPWAWPRSRPLPRHSTIASGATATIEPYLFRSCRTCA